MLRPTKHTNLQSAHISVGAAVLQVIGAQGRASFTDVERAVHRWCGDVGQRRIQETLVLLYALGLLDYAEDLDAFVSASPPGRSA